MFKYCKIHDYYTTTRKKEKLAGAFYYSKPISKYKRLVKPRTLRKLSYISNLLFFYFIEGSAGTKPFVSSLRKN